MIILKNYHSEIIREFSEQEFSSHIQLIKDILSVNNFENTGIANLLINYLKIIEKKYNDGYDKFNLSKNETFLYDLSIEVIRLCYKHSYETSENSDWENEFL